MRRCVLLQIVRLAFTIVVFHLRVNEGDDGGHL